MSENTKPKTEQPVVNPNQPSPQKDEPKAQKNDRKDNSRGEMVRIIPGCPPVLLP